jgi:hypothetical protein
MPVTVGSINPIPNVDGPLEFVVRSVADWQALYGPGSSPPSSVNFSTQMILIYMAEECTCSYPFFQSVCETGTEVDVTLSVVSNCWSIYCYPVSQYGYGAIAVVVPLSNLPVVWNLPGS